MAMVASQPNQRSGQPRLPGWLADTGRVAAGLGILGGLFWLSRPHFLLFHGIVELFSIVVACGIFGIAWNARARLENNYLLFLGIAYLFVGVVDLVHTMAYKGLTLLPWSGVDYAAQFWIVARGLQSLALLLAPWFLRRRLPVAATLLGFAVVVALALLSVTVWRRFPTCFVEGRGLTPFKILAEWAICLILVAALVVLGRQRRQFEPLVWRWVAGSIVATIASELAFTRYHDPYEPINALGHLLKLLAFYLIYKALIETGLRRPYDLLFRTLTASEQKYRSLFATQPDALVLFDAATLRNLEVNDAAVAMYGYSREEFLAADYGLLYAEPERTRQRIEAVCSRGVLHVPFRLHRRKDGLVFPVELAASYFEIGGRRLVYAAIRDIAERQKAEETLRQSREDLNRAQAVAHTGSWRLDVCRNELLWSDENHRIFGIPKGAAMTYETFLAAVHPDDRQYVDRQWKAALSGKPYDIEHRIVVDGAVKWVRERAELEFDEGGALLGGFGTTQDVTERKRVEEQIENLAKFPSENPYPVLRISRAGATLYANEPGSVLLKRWGCQVGEPAPDEWRRTIAEVLTTNRVRVQDIECGQTVYSVTVVPIGAGGYVNMYGRDATKEREGERLLREARDELEQRVRERTAELVAANEQLLAHQRELRLLGAELALAEQRERRRIAEAMHDGIGPVLAMANMKLGYLQRSVDHAEQVAALEEIHRMIDQVIRYTRTLTIELFPPMLYTVGFEAALAWLADRTQEQYGIQCTFEDDQQAKPMTDEAKVLLFQAARELLNNAVKHAAARRAWVRVARRDTTVEVAVEDDGVGFDPSTLETRRAQGGGYGLFSIRERLTCLGGKLAIRSARGSGTCAIMTAPLQWLPARREGAT